MKKHLDAMLAGGPLVAHQVIDATLARLRDAGATLAQEAADRQQFFDLLEALQLQQPVLVTAFGLHIKSEIESAAEAPRKTVSVPPGPIRPEELTLMDEDQAEKDIEVSRTIELIDLKAEWELRELQALTASLLGDTVLRPQANPCRPMVYARALDQAAHELRVSKAGRNLFLRNAGFALADVLRDVYGDANRRLKSWGVQALEFRTAPTVRTGTAPEVDLTQPGALLTLRDRLHKGGGLNRKTTTQRTAPMAPPGGPGPSAPQQQTAELLSRLFDHILADPGLQPTVKHVLVRLQASVLRVALADPLLLATHEHPTWMLINQIAEHTSDHPQFSDARGSAFMDFVEPLIERLAVAEVPDAALYHRALSDVQAFIDHEDEEQLQHSQAALKALAEAEPLGSGEEYGRVKAAAQRWLQTLTKGARCKLFLQGQWVTAHLLWRSDNGEFFMFTSPVAGGMHSMTRRALERLRIEGLATTFVELSLMQRAADSVLQGLDEA